MVLERRTPVALRPELTNAPKNVELWWIGSTQEGFFTYEEFLKRQHYLAQVNTMRRAFSEDPAYSSMQRIFTCEITGHGGLTYEQALQSERRGALEIDTQFPEPLKGPILRHIQFSTEPRIDHVVETLINIFSKEFFPNETVIWAPPGGSREEARIREKTSFPEIRNPDGSLLRSAKARYFVELPKKGGEGLLARAEELSRHRKHFNKQVLRSFLRNSVQPRESWAGAPWVVKEDIARLYHIPTEVPANLRHEAVIEEKKRIALAQRTAKDEDYLQGLADKGQLPGVDQGAVLTPEQFARFHAMLVDQRTRNEKEGKGPGRWSNGSKISVFQAQLLKAQKSEPLKYPCDDLRIPNKKRNPVSRPALKFLNHSAPSLANTDMDLNPLPLTGHLLQVWHTLNVFAPLFIMDSFTFDDMVQAIAVWSIDQPCELFSEIHCAILKVAVNRDGELQVRSLVENSSRNSEWDRYLAPESDSMTEEREPNGDEINEEGPLLATDKARILKAFPSTDDWSRSVGECRFANDGWQFLYLGFLTQIAMKSKDLRGLCESLLAKLMPANEDVELGESNVRDTYSALDFESRVLILQIAILHIPDTKGVRVFMEDCDREATETRKKKIVWQSRKKSLVREWQELDQQRKFLRPDAVNASDVQEIPVALGGDDTEEEPESADEGKENDAESDNEEESAIRSSRSSGRANAMKRKREEEEAEKELQKKMKVDLDDSARYEKVLRDMKARANEIKECEEEIRQHDNALRENSCHRARKLGTDRYLNHYYWYERNGMAFGGDEDSSTSEHGYANGCIWVQGPDTLQAVNVIKLDTKAAERYAKETGITLVERKDRDEGTTQLSDANHWGYIDTPEDLDKLIAYLDDRGKDEKVLRKELKTWRGEIANRMMKRKQRLEHDDLLRQEDDEPAVGVATRRKQEATKIEAKFPCLIWYNSMALGELGRIHSDGRRSKPGPKSKASRQKALGAVAEKELTTRSGRRR